MRIVEFLTETIKSLHHTNDVKSIRSLGADTVAQNHKTQVHRCKIKLYMFTFKKPITKSYPHVQHGTLRILCCVGNHLYPLRGLFCYISAQSILYLVLFLRLVQMCASKVILEYTYNPFQLNSRIKSKVLQINFLFQYHKNIQRNTKSSLLNRGHD